MHRDLTDPPFEAHVQMALRAIRDELQTANEIIEAELEAGVWLGRKIRTDAWQRYQNVLKPPSLRTRLTCAVVYHDGIACEQDCCGGAWTWCRRCGAVRPTPPVVPSSARGWSVSHA